MVRRCAVRLRIKCLVRTLVSHSSGDAPAAIAQCVLRALFLVLLMGLSRTHIAGVSATLANRKRALRRHRIAGTGSNSEPA